MSENQIGDSPRVVEDTQIPDKVVCHAAKDPAVRVFILAGMCLGFGIWCFLDKHNHVKPEIWDMKHINDIVSYYLNNFGYWVLVPLGIIIVLMAVRMIMRVLVADGEGIGYAGKERLKWVDYSSIDVSKLKDKGILTIHFSDDRKILLDSWKLKNFKQLVAFVESKTS